MSSIKFDNLRDKVVFIFNESNCSQAKISRMLGISEAYVSEIVKGKKKINLSDTLVKLICHEFSVNPEWMFSDIGEIYISKVTGEHDSTNIELGERKESDLEEKMKELEARLEARIVLLEKLFSQSRPNPGRRWYDPIISKKK